MHGITISGTRHKETTKLLSHLCSFMFEQECGELRNFSKDEIEILEKAKKVLANRA